MGFSFPGWIAGLAFVLLALGTLAYYRQVIDMIASFFRSGGGRDRGLERRTQELLWRYQEQDGLEHWTPEDDQEAESNASGDGA